MNAREATNLQGQYQSPKDKLYTKMETECDNLIKKSASSGGNSVTFIVRDTLPGPSNSYVEEVYYELYKSLVQRGFTVYRNYQMNDYNLIIQWPKYKKPEISFFGSNKNLFL